MTTLLGIKTNSGEEAVVLVTDTQVIFGNDESKGRTPFYKTAIGEFWALSSMGTHWDGSRKFYNKLTSPKRYKDTTEKDVEKIILEAIKKERFIEIDTLNAEYMLADGDGESGTLQFLFGTNKPKIELYFIDSYGNLRTTQDLNNEVSLIVKSTDDGIEDSIYNTILEKIRGEDVGSSDRIDLETALKVAYEGMKKIDVDLYSGGPIDITVITKDGVFNYGKQIKKALADAESAAFENILSKYEKDKEESRSPDSN